MIPSDWGKVFWMLSEVDDPRFSYDRFGGQPIWLVKQAIAALQQRTNMNQLTQARLMQVYINSHISEKGKPVDNIGNLVPYPNTWRNETSDNKLSIDKKTAKEILSSLDWLDISVTSALSDWIDELNSIVND